MADRHLYASDAEDNHEEPWTDSYDPGECEPADVAKWYAEENGLNVGDHVYVIEASEAERPDTDDPETDGWPLDVHRTWSFVVAVATDAGCVVEEVA